MATLLSLAVSLMAVYTECVDDADCAEKGKTHALVPMSVILSHIEHINHDTCALITSVLSQTGSFISDF